MKQPLGVAPTSIRADIEQEAGTGRPCFQNVGQPWRADERRLEIVDVNADGDFHRKVARWVAAGRGTAITAALPQGKR